MTLNADKRTRPTHGVSGDPTTGHLLRLLRWNWPTKIIPTTHMKRPCLHCPYRKDKPNWMDTIRTLFNITLVRRNVAQQCHMATKHVCYGAVVCINGGDHQIVSPQELANRELSGNVREDYDKGSKIKAGVA